MNGYRGRASGRSLTGVVRDDGGRPVAGACIEVEYGTASRGATLKSAADGTFQIDHLADGPVVLKAAAVVHSRWSETIDVGSAVEPLVVTLVRHRAIIVRLIDAQGKPRSRRTIRCTRKEPDESTRTYGFRELPEFPGTYVTLVPPGHWIVRAIGGESDGVNVDVTQGGKDLELRLR